MFSRSAKALGVVATVELLVLVLAVGRFGVLLLLAVVAALSAFGTVFLFSQPAGMFHQPVDGAVSVTPTRSDRFHDPVLRILAGPLLTIPQLPTASFGGLLTLQPVRSAVRPPSVTRMPSAAPDQLINPPTHLRGSRSRRHAVDGYSTMRDPQGF